MQYPVVLQIYEFDLRAGLVNELVDVESAISKEASLVIKGLHRFMQLIYNGANWSDPSNLSQKLAKMQYLPFKILS